MNRFLPSHAVPYSFLIFWGHFPTDSCQLFNYFAGRGGRRESLVGWLVGWLLSQRLKNSNYHLIIKNACAYRINPSASIAPFRIRIRLVALLIAYQCSISISRARISRWDCGCGCEWGRRWSWAGVVGQDALQDALSGSQSAWQFITVSLTAMASPLTLAAAATEAETETAASLVAICW